MTDYHRTAALALAKCAAYDPWFPKPSQAIVDSWAEQVEKYKLEVPDVLAGVTKMYSDNGSGFRPLPKDLIDAARAVRRDRTERESDAERMAREERRDADLEARNRDRLAALVGGIADAKSIPAER
jgi:hypothetical protein